MENDNPMSIDDLCPYTSKCPNSGYGCSPACRDYDNCNTYQSKRQAEIREMARWNSSYQEPDEYDF